MFLREPLNVAMLIQAEMLLGIWLLVGGFERARFFVATVCFCLFAAVSIYEALHAVPSCGCFGNVKVPPVVIAGIDIGGVTALWLARPLHSGWLKEPSSLRRIVAGSCLAAFMSAGFWTLYSFRRVPIDPVPTSDDTTSLVVLEPKSWIHQPFPLLQDIDGASVLSSGRWLVVLYHYDCDACLQAIPNYSTWARTNAKDSFHAKLALIAMPPLPSASQDPILPSSEFERFALRSDHDWFATTPVVVALENGRVLTALDGNDAIHPPNVAW
jgi:hypothetical protein